MALVQITHRLSDPMKQLLREQLQALQLPAIALSLDYRIVAANAAYLMHYGHQVKEGHDHCFAVSHGYESPCDENGEQCPLAQARRTGRPERVCHVHDHPGGPEHVDVEVRPVTDAAGAVVAFIEVIEPIPQAAAGVGGAPLVGRSRAFSGLLSLLNRVAPTDATVLLLGESGTGKELCAKAIHDRSARSRGPFVPVECSGLSETLFESELFGHVKGAFTGAVVSKVGLVQAASGGTLFLDELGEIPQSLQVKLLRLLETGTYRRVGDAQVQRANFRLVCATHRHLSAMIEEGTFRRDLYYRLSVFPVQVPALRERMDDLPLLAQAMLVPQGKRLSAAAVDALGRHAFPGNIRELKNILQRAVILTDGPVIDEDALPAELTSTATATTTTATATATATARATTATTTTTTASRLWPPAAREVVPLEALVDRYLLWLAEATGDRTMLASQLGLSPRTLYRRLAEARARRAAETTTT